MKNNITLLLIFFTYSIKSQTCYINPGFIASSQTGFYPSATIGIANGKVGLPYGESLTIKSKKDTQIVIVGSVLICITRYEMVSPPGVTNFGLPSGLSIQGIPANVRIAADATGCALIKGTPTAAGTFNLSFQLNRYCIPIASGSCPVPSNPNTGSATIITPLIYKLALTVAP